VDTLWTAAFERNMEADGGSSSAAQLKRDAASDEAADFSELFSASDIPLSLLMAEH